MIDFDPQLEVVGQAHDGREAVALAESLRPDVITMDIDMPHVNGLQATEMIMSRHPRPIVIVSSESRQEAAVARQALELGAIDFVTKPSAAIDLDMNTIREDLNRKIKLAAKVRVIRTATRPANPDKSRPAGVSAASSGVTRSAHGSAQVSDHRNRCLYGRTGGHYPCRSRLAGGFAGRGLSCAAYARHFYRTVRSPTGRNRRRSPVKTASPNEMVQSGTIYLCPGSHNLSISSTGKILLDAGTRAEGYRYRPSADLALETAAEYARSVRHRRSAHGYG